MTFAFEKLMVYQKSVDFADRVCSITSDFSARYNFFADQLNRAALSISSNIAEGNGRFTKADRKNFFGIASNRLLAQARRSRDRPTTPINAFLHQPKRNECPCFFLLLP